jgi:plastocyanin
VTRAGVLTTAAVLLVATVLASACSATGVTEPVATSKVTMAKSYRFDPKVITVKAGDTVTWTNDDNFTHTVDFDDRPDLEVGRGKSVTITFSKPGTYHYVCRLHSMDMDGTVIVR